jgi:hypothetical protein
MQQRRPRAVACRPFVRRFVAHLFEAPRPEVKYKCMFKAVRMRLVRVAKDSDLKVVRAYPLGRLEVAVPLELGIRDGPFRKKLCNRFARYGVGDGVNEDIRHITPKPVRNGELRTVRRPEGITSTAKVSKLNGGSSDSLKQERVAGVVFGTLARHAPPTIWGLPGGSQRKLSPSAKGWYCHQQQRGMQKEAHIAEQSVWDKVIDAKIKSFVRGAF